MNEQNMSLSSYPDLAYEIKALQIENNILKGQNQILKTIN